MKTIILDTQVKSLRAVLTNPATTQPTFTAHYYDSEAATITELSSDGALNGTVAVEIVAPPATNIRRVVKEVTIYNSDTITHVVTFFINNDDTERRIWQGAFSAGCTILLSQLSSSEIAINVLPAKAPFVDDDVFMVEDSEDGFSKKKTNFPTKELLKKELSSKELDPADVPLFVSVPSTETSPGVKGQVAIDNNYLYVCHNTDLWGRYSRTW